MNTHATNPEGSPPRPQWRQSLPPSLGSRRQAPTAATRFACLLCAPPGSSWCHLQVSGSYLHCLPLAHQRLDVLRILLRLTLHAAGAHLHIHYGLSSTDTRGPAPSVSVCSSSSVRWRIFTSSLLIRCGVI